MSQKELTQVLRKAALEPVFRKQLASDISGTLRKESVVLDTGEIKLLQELDLANWSLTTVNSRLRQEGLDMITPV